MEAFGKFKNDLALLIACVIKYERNRHSHTTFRYLIKKFANTLRVDIGFIADRDQFMSNRVQCPENIETFSS